MKRMKQILATFIVVMLVLSIATGCTSKQTTGDTSQSTTSEKKSEGSEPVPSKAPPDEISAFIWVWVTFPEDVDPVSNPFIDKFLEKANVKITEAEVPAPVEGKSRLALLISSNQLPDLIYHEDRWNVNTYGDKGVFLPLNDYIEKSPILKNWFPPEVWEGSKTAKGNIYNIYAKEPEIIYVDVARLDLIDKLNGGVVPTTPDGWYEFAKKVKANNPNATPFISRGEIYWLFPTFRAFGVQLSSANLKWLDYEGEIYSPLGHPRMRECVEYHRMLYQEGLLDREFVSITGDQAYKKYYTNDVILNTVKPESIPDLIIQTRRATDNPDAVWGAVPHMVAPGVDPQYVCWPRNIRGFRCFSMPAYTTKADACIRLIEAFCDEDLVIETVWGREGIEHNIVNGERVLDRQNHDKTNYRNAYAFMWQQAHISWTRDLIEQYYIEAYNQQGIDGAAIFRDYVRPAFELSIKNGDTSGPSRIWAYVTPDDIALQQSDALQEAKKIVIQAIMGQISMEEYDRLAAKFENDYKHITEDLKNWWEKNRHLYDH